MSKNDLHLLSDIKKEARNEGVTLDDTNQKLTNEKNNGQINESDEKRFKSEFDQSIVIGRAFDPSQHVEKENNVPE